MEAVLAPAAGDVVRLRAQAERIGLGDGRWIEVMAKRSERRPSPDQIGFLCEVLAACVRSTNITDAAGALIDPAKPAAWTALSRDEVLRLARAMTKLARKGRIEADG